MNMNQIGIIVEILGFICAVLFACTFLEPKITGNWAHYLTRIHDNWAKKLKPTDSYLENRLPFEIPHKNVVESIFLLNPAELFFLLLIVVIRYFFNLCHSIFIREKHHQKITHSGWELTNPFWPVFTTKSYLYHALIWFFHIRGSRCFM